MAERIHLGGVTNTTLHIEADGVVHLEEKQDCQAIIDANQRARDHRFHGASPGGEFHEVATLPMVVLLQWQKECGHAMYSPEFDAYMDAKLRSPEFSALRAAPALRDPHIIVKGAR